MSVPLNSTGSLSSPCTRTPAVLPLATRGRRLVEGLRPFMVSRNAVGLADFLCRDQWTETGLIAMLTCADVTVIRAATWCLAHVGTMKANLPLASILHHDDPSTVDLAENALWSVWLRGARPEHHARLCSAIRHTEQDYFDKALQEMDEIITSCPEYAEAYNQRAIVRFLGNDCSGAIADYQQVVSLNSVHFGALAGLGHCFAALGRYSDALNAYQRVLAVHPRMEGIRQAISQIRRLVQTPAPGHIPTKWL